MGRLWCAKDPPVSFFGAVWNITLMVQESQQEKVLGAPTLTIVSHPLANAAVIPMNDDEEPAFNGFGLIANLVEDDSLDTHRVRLSVDVPASGNVNARFVVIGPNGDEHSANGPARHLVLEFDVGA